MARRRSAEPICDLCGTEGHRARYCQSRHGIADADVARMQRAIIDGSVQDATVRQLALSIELEAPAGGAKCGDAVHRQPALRQR